MNNCQLNISSSVVVILKIKYDLEVSANKLGHAVYLVQSVERSLAPTGIFPFQPRRLIPAVCPAGG